MTDIKLTQKADGTYDASIDGLSVTIVPYVAPPAPPPAPPSVNVAFTTKITAAGVLTVKDTSTLLPEGAVGYVYYGDTHNGSIRAGNVASYAYKAQGTYTLSLKWKATDGTVYSAGGTVVYDGADHASVSDPGTTITPPSATPPAPPPAGSPPASTPLPPSVPPPTANAGAGAHAVALTVVDGAGMAWSAQTNVGDDATVAAIYMSLTNAAGEAHQGLTAWFYADCAEAGVGRFDCAYDYLGCTSVTVTYDGAVMPMHVSSNADGTFDFSRLTRCPPIRYGEQVAWDASKIDWSLLPSWAKEPQNAFDDSKMDHTFNGVGTASTTTMGQGGDRIDLGCLPVWDMPFVLTPNDANWAVVRRAADHCGGFGGVYICTPETGRIVDATVYTNTTTLPQAQVHGYPNNMLTPYLGSYRGDVLDPKSVNAWAISASKFVPAGDHYTGYALLAAMITGTARDRDHASFWSNWPLLEVGPQYTQATGTINTSQRRCAWTTRNLFMASYNSSDTAYFSKWLAKNLATLDAYPKNEFGLFDLSVSYPRAGPGVVDTSGYMGMAVWQQHYMCICYDPIQRKLPEWKPFAQYLAKLEVLWASKPYAMVECAYYLPCHDPAGAMMADFDLMVHKSLVFSQGFTDEEASLVVGAPTVQDAYNAVVAHNARIALTWAGKYVNGVSDYMSYMQQPGGYNAEAISAAACAVNCGAVGAASAWAVASSVPTPIDYSANQKFHIVPRAAA